MKTNPCVEENKTNNGLMVAIQKKPQSAPRRDRIEKIATQKRRI